MRPKAPCSLTLCPYPSNPVPLPFALTLTLAFAFFLGSCSSHKYSLENKPESYVVIGSGGGFTNLVASTYVYPNGQVFETQTFVDTTITHPNIKRSQTRKLFRDLKDSEIKTLKFSQPGNIYLFLKYIEDGQEYYFSWDAAGQRPPDSISRFYIRISELTNPE